MRLSYRGIPYETQASEIPAMPGEISGKYRGADFKVNQPSVRSQVQTAILQYRGVLYVKG